MSWSAMLEADAHVATAAAEDRRVDTDHLAVEVDQRTARIAGVDGGVGLDEILVVADAHAGAPLGADHAYGEGVTEAEGVADSDHPLADFERGGVRQPQRWQTAGVDLDDGHI
jgi:hypothetical protein